ncbi:MAG: AmmeMemoRadiSam system protein B [Phycisphaerae bacterium]
MNVRQPFRAGSFYESSTSSCRLHVERLYDSVELAESVPSDAVGGIVPHAGWMFSGRLAAQTFRATLSDQIRTVVLFGADHTQSAEMGEVFDTGVWRTPLGEVEVDEELASAVMASGDRLRSNPEAHKYEHAIEVQVPMVQVAAPNAKILPITLPPRAVAIEVGRTVGQVLNARDDSRAVIIGSTDLTHVGGHFGSPVQRGQETERYAADNDRTILRRIEQMNAEGVLEEASVNASACGAGAVAATIAACSELGAGRGEVLEYTNSYRVVHEMNPGETDDTTVGYASVIFV